MIKKPIHTVMLAVAVLVILIGCNLPQAGSPPTPQAESTERVESLPSPTNPVESPTSLPATPTTPLQPTATSQPSATETSPTETVATGPMCNILQDLNLRTGPGTAYRPPIRALPAQTVVVPLGYNPVGIPGGTWVQVREPGANEVGWVSAGDQYVSCNIDLTTLPSVAVPTPAPPPPPDANNSTPDGTFPPNFIWEADFNDQYFVRFKVYDTNSGETDDGDGISEVSFQVLDGDENQVYQRTERQSGFCIFGGGEPDCNPWLIEDNVYKWSAGGEPVKTGQYRLLIVVTASSGEQGNWNYDVDLKLPQ